MHSICFVVSYIDFSTLKNLINRINARKLSENEISILCYEGSYLSYLETYCQNKQIKFIKLLRSEFNNNITIQNIPFLISLAAFHKLAKLNFNEINFIDLSGIGFHSIQAKKMGISFKNTNLNVEMFGGSQYRNELSEEWGHGGFDQLMVQYMERYCCEFCDKLISPINAMISWTQQNKWNLCENREIRYFDPLDNNMQYVCNISSKCLVFSSNLGKEGGLHLFINALKRMVMMKNNNIISKIIFFGEYKLIDNMPANEYIENNLNKNDYCWEIMGANTTEQLLETVSKNNGILVFSSTMDINGQDIVTAANCNINMIVSDNEAHREIFEEDSLFTLSPSGIIDAIIHNKFAIKRKKINLQRFENFHLKQDVNIEQTTNETNDFPLVTICTAYYNHGEFLDMARKSIEIQDYTNIEWIVVDDGSTDKKSIELLEKYSEEYKDRPYKFIRKKNEGPSIARNYCANNAKGELLVFMDSDNIAKPNMISKFVRSLKNSNCDCLSCYFDQFIGPGEVTSKSLNGITYALLGPSLETGIFSNCFGDTNFIIKKSVFDKVGGFLPQRVVTEDWQILSSIALKGFKIDVIPEALFWYRILPESNVSYGSEYYKQQIILRTYCNELPPYVYHIFNSLCRPSLSVKESLNMTRVGAFYVKLVEVANLIFPLGSKRRHGIKRLIDKLIKTKI